MNRLFLDGNVMEEGETAKIDSFYLQLYFEEIL